MERFQETEILGAMPSKDTVVQSRKWQADPRVPIRGDRVRAALQWRGFSNNEAVRLLAKKGVRLTPQGLDFITAGKAKTCRASLRKALARLCGPPVTAKWLGGEVDLVAPPLPIGPLRAGQYPRSVTDMIGRAYWESYLRYPEATSNLPPRYELEAMALAKGIEQAWKREQASEQVWRDFFPNNAVPELLTPIRFLLSLRFWRRYVNYLGQEQGQSLEAYEGHDEFADDCSEFAAALARAISILLKPWLDGRLRARESVLRSAIGALGALHYHRMDLDDLDEKFEGEREYFEMVASGRLDELRKKE